MYSMRKLTEAYKTDWERKKNNGENKKGVLLTDQEEILIFS